MLLGRSYVYTAFSKINPLTWGYRSTDAVPSEQKKVILGSSFKTALQRCGVHLVPMLFSIVILTLNLKGYYIGVGFASLIQSETLNLLLLQVAAKIQELLIVASLTTIIFHIVRHELLVGDGLPLGLIGSGLAFSDISYFFSTEFLGSLYYLRYRWRKFWFLAVLLLAGVMAALAGPATATLLVPKSQTWPAGGTSFFLNGGSNDLWPSILSENASWGPSDCALSGATNNSLCPSGGFRSLWEHWGQYNQSNFQTDSVASYAKELSGSSYYWTVDSPLSDIPRLYTLGNSRMDEKTQSSTFLVQSHAATVIMLQRITTDWWAALLSQMKRPSGSIDDRVAQSDTLNPITQVRCSAPQNLSSNTLKVNFPKIVSPWIWDTESTLPVSFPNASAEHIQFRWIHLPDNFGPSTIGSVFESPWMPDNRSRVVIGCTIHSTWVPATLFTDMYSFWTGWYPWNVQFGTRFPTWEAPPKGKPLAPDNGRIAVSDSWLRALTPPTPPEGPGHGRWQPSTIESILMNAGLAADTTAPEGSTVASEWRKEDLSGSGKTLLLESIICNVVNDGLARSGSHRIYNLSSTNPTSRLSLYERKRDFDKRIVKGQDAINVPNIPPKNVTRLHVKMKITGYAFEGSIAGFLSMVVLLTHLAFALCHITWILWHRTTSKSWDSISGLIALALNSRPALQTLQNTGAGIELPKIFAHTAKIRVNDHAGKMEDHVELVFEDRPHDENKGQDEELELGDGRAPELGMARIWKRSGAANDIRSARRNGRHGSPSTWPKYSRDSSTESFISETSCRERSSSVTSLLGSNSTLLPDGLHRRVEIDHTYS